MQLDYLKLREILKDKNISTKKLHEEILLRGGEISFETVSAYRKGNAKTPKSEILKFIADILNVSMFDLIENGEEFKSIFTKDLEITQKVKDENIIDIPYFENSYVCQGSSTTVNYDDVWKPITFDRRFLEKKLNTRNFKNLHIINTIGNSMEPTIKEGELLIVNPYENESSIINGAIYTVMYYDQALVKRIVNNPKTNQTTLHSDNDTQHPSIDIEENDKDHFKIIGRVLAHFDFL